MKNILAILTLTLFVTACDDDMDATMTEAKPARVGLEMRAMTTSSEISRSARQLETGLVFKEALLGVTKLEFESDDENRGGRDDHDDDIEFKGRYVVDLIAGQSTPDFGMAGIRPGVYDEIEFELTGLLDNGASMFIAFDKPINGNTVRVEYSTREDFELEVEDEKGFQLNDTENHVLILFHLDKLMNRIDLTRASPDDDGIIRINANSNSRLASQIRDNIDDAFEAGDDDDDDDRFDDDDDQDDDHDDKDHSNDDTDDDDDDDDDDDEDN